MTGGNAVDCVRREQQWSAVSALQPAHGRCARAPGLDDVGKQGRWRARGGALACPWRGVGVPVAATGRILAVARRCSMIMTSLRPTGRSRASVVQGKTPTSRWEMQVQGLPGAPPRALPLREGPFCAPPSTRSRTELVCLEQTAPSTAQRCHYRRKPAQVTNLCWSTSPPVRPCRSAAPEYRSSSPRCPSAESRSAGCPAAARRTPSAARPSAPGASVGPGRARGRCRWA